MNLRHFNKQKSKKIYTPEDSFDIFSSHERLFEAPVVKKDKNYLVVFLAFVALVVTIVAGVSLVYKPKGINPYSLVAIRTVNVSGNSVGGTKVFINNKELGLTDSFGEWRKYIRLEESSSHKLRVEKVLGKKKYSAEKTFKIKFNQDQVTEVSFSLELKSKAFANMQSKEKIKAPVLKKVVEVPQDLISIEMRKPKKGRKSLLAKHQTSVLEDKVIPALISDLDKKGIKHAKNSKWKLVFSYVPKKGDVGYIKGDVSWVDQKGATHRTSFIKEFSRTINDTARSLSTTIKSHVSKGYWGSLEKGSWKLNLDSVPEYWKFRRDRVLVDQVGKAYPVSVRLKDGKLVSAEMMTGGFSPCRTEVEGAKCYFMSKSIEEQTPRPGWESHTLKGYGKLPKDAQIFVAGYKALSLGNNKWRYWAPNDGLVKVNIISKDNIWQSYSFRSSKEKDNHISFRGRRLSHR